MPKPKGPCDGCEFQAGCGPYSLLNVSLFGAKSYRSPPLPSDVDLALDSVVEAFAGAMKRHEASGVLSKQDRGQHLSALFDLLVTGIYTNNMLAAYDRFRQSAVVDGSADAFFPYVWMHPQRVARGMPLADCYLPGARREDGRDYPMVDMLAKPGGRFIGDVGIKVLKSILRRLLAVNAPTTRLRDGGGLRGEFDLTVTSDDLLVFAEVKAKPLISYPLHVTLRRPVGGPQLEWKDIPFEDVVGLSLYLGAADSDLSLSLPKADEFLTWPMPDIRTAVEDDHQFLLIVANWKRHLAGYRKWEAEPRETRWHRFGCGNFSTAEGGSRLEKRVANTKELPGLDRTDDIKKGAAQLLKFSRYKFECQKHAIRCVLIGNTHAETHAENYIDPLLDLKILRSADPSQRQEWIFDAVVSLTQNHFNSPDMQLLFDLDRL